MSKILFDTTPLVIDIALANKIGLNEAIVLQQVHYWIEINKNKNINFYDGCYWTYNSIKNWHEQFTFFGQKTLTRIFNNLIKIGLLKVGNYNKMKMDRTKWYTIDYEKLNSFMEDGAEQNDQMHFPKKGNAIGQNGQMEQDDLTECNETKSPDGIGQNDQIQQDNLTQPIPETNTETSTEITTETNTKIKKNISKRDAQNKIITLYEQYANGDKELLECLLAFVKMRNSIKSALTEHAAKLMLKELDKLTSDRDTKIEIVNRSIMNNWKGVFPLSADCKRAQKPIYIGNGYTVQEAQQKTAMEKLKAKYGE